MSNNSQAGEPKFTNDPWTICSQDNNSVEAVTRDLHGPLRLAAAGLPVAADVRVPKSLETDSSAPGIPEGHAKYLNTVSPEPVSPDQKIPDIKEIEQEIEDIETLESKVQKLEEALENIRFPSERPWSGTQTARPRKSVRDMS